MSRQLRCMGVLLPVLSIALAGFSYAQDGKPAKPDEKKPEAKKPDDKKPAEAPKTDAKKPEVTAGKDVAATISESKDHATLAKLLAAAGLVDTLKGKGPFTVFGPDDKAFDKVGKATVDEWMKPENKEKLKGILLAHVVSGKVASAELAKQKEVKTMGGSFPVTAKDGKVMVDTATVTKADIAASNGVIHSVDTVLMPKAAPSPEKKGHGG